MLAAADYAEHGGDPVDKDGNLPPQAPSELLQAFRIQEWGVQALYNDPIPAGELKRMTTALNVYRAFRSYRIGANNFAAWSKSHPDEYEIVADIRKVRLEDDLP